MKISKRQFLEQFNSIKLVHSTRLVANALASFAGCKELFPSQDAIMERAGISDKRSLRKALDFLTEHGFIKFENKKYVLLLRESTEPIEPQRKKNGTYTKKQGDKYVKVMCNNANNASNITQSKGVIVHSKMQYNTFANNQLYIKNYKLNFKYNYNLNYKYPRASSPAPFSLFSGVHDSCKNDCQNEKTEIENLLAENQKLKNALEAIESKNKSLGDEILNLNKKIEISAASASQIDIELQSLKAENEKLKEKREKREVAEQKKIEKINQNSAKWASDEEIENFRFEQKHIDVCKKNKNWNDQQITLAEIAFVAQMMTRKERNENPFKNPSLLAFTYITNGYLDKAVHQPRQYNNSTNNDVNSKSYCVDNIHKVEMARMREEEQQKKAKTFDVDFDPEEFTREFNAKNNIENLPARPEPVRQNLFGIGTRR